MYLSGYFLGVSYLINTNKTPTARAYSGVKFYGQNTLSNIQIYDKLLSQEEINAIGLDYTPIWNENTILLAQFTDNNLVAGNIKNLNKNIMNWEIDRKEKGETSFKKLAVIDNDITEYIDWTTSANKSYTYNIFPVTDEEIGEPLITNEINTNYYGWYLIDKDTNAVYMFDLNVKSGNITNEVDFTEYKGYNQYSAFSVGKRDYIKGNLSAIAGNISNNGVVNQSNAYLDDLRTFVNNGNPKILKNRKGNVWNVMTTNYQQNILDDGISEQLYNISFDFIECSKV